MLFIKLRKFSTPIFSKSFFLTSWMSKWFLNLSNNFSASTDNIMWFFSFFFNLLIWLIDCFSYVELACFPGRNPTWSWCRLFLYVAKFCLLIFLRAFASIIIRDNVLQLYLWGCLSPQDRGWAMRSINCWLVVMVMVVAFLIYLSLFILLPH